MDGSAVRRARKKTLGKKPKVLWRNLRMRGAGWGKSFNFHSGLQFSFLMTDNLAWLVRPLQPF
jgi:hypothetical protein